MRISPKEIQKSYAVLKGVARRHLDAGRIEDAMETIRHCVVLAQQFNWIYADADLEQMEKEIGERLIPRHIEDYKVDNNRVVVFDDFCVTFVLALQYIEALVKNGKEVMLLSTRPIEGPNNIRFFEYLKRYEKLQIVRIEEPQVDARMQKINNTIIEYRPSQLLLHLYANSIIIPILFCLPKQIKSYLINLADQTFWLGAGAIDYCIEFRPFGATVSRERRGIKPEQQLMLPFYPIVDNNPFQGFPNECTEEGKVLIFAGSDIYKVLDEKRMFWHLVKRLLDTFPEIVFLFATKADDIGIDFLHKFISDNHYEKRFLYTQFRPDIDEVLAHVDIYMGTCPASGSLMSQLAARNAKPILQYYYPGTPDDETEQAICINDKFQISFQDEEAFMMEAHRLIKNADYRKAQGKRLQQAMIQPEQFNKALESLLATNQSPFPVETIEVDYKMLEERWYALEKAGFLNTLSYLFGLLGKKKCLKYAPTLYFKKQLMTFESIILKKLYH